LNRPQASDSSSENHPWPHLNPCACLLCPWPIVPRPFMKHLSPDFTIYERGADPGLARIPGRRGFRHEKGRPPHIVRGLIRSRIDFRSLIACTTSPAANYVSFSFSLLSSSFAIFRQKRIKRGFHLPVPGTVTVMDPRCYNAKAL
jgi:hypothetical protein